MEAATIVNNEKEQRFEIKVGEEYAYLTYRFYKNDLALMHTFVPHEGRGQNLGGQLAAHALTYARERNMKIMVYCPFVSQYMKRHPEFDDLVDRKYRG